MNNLKITDIKTFITAPEDCNLVVVKVLTNEPELYGLGCATFTQRCLTVKSALDDYLKPLLIGRNPLDTEDLWNMCNVNGYWRNGPILNNALSGVDMALWDIKGKVANMPVYDLLGGKCRDAIKVYRHAFGKDVYELEDDVHKWMDQDYKNIRIQVGGYGSPELLKRKVLSKKIGTYQDTDAYIKGVLKTFDHIRSTIGYDINVLHDVHERITPTEAVMLAKELEQYRLYFLEDVLAPEQIRWLKNIKQVTTTPIAIGELYNHPLEWQQTVMEHMLDFIRIHISQIGGITPAKKLVSLCDITGVKTAWHGPPDLAPIGLVASLHLDISCMSFGIQEYSGLTELRREMFPGCPEVKDGHLVINDKPGFGMDFDEKLAEKYPHIPQVQMWTQGRNPDGSLLLP